MARAPTATFFRPAAFSASTSAVMIESANSAGCLLFVSELAGAEGALGVSRLMTSRTICSMSTC